MIAWLVLFAYGLSGVLSVLINDKDYTEANYFKTNQFEYTLRTFTNYLYTYEVQSKEEMKNAITVSKEEIDEHRYRYGGLTEQIENIEQQYNSKIDEAKTNGHENLEDIYIKERDTKIEDITKNFESDEYVEQKVRKEKEASIENYLKELEVNRGEYQRYREAFVYYLKNTSTGDVFTNLPTKDSETVDQYINDQTSYFIQSYPTKNNGYLKLGEDMFIPGIIDYFRNHANDLFEGSIAVTKDAPKTNIIMLEYQSFAKERIIFWIYSAGALLALIASIWIGRKIGIISRLAPEKWQGPYSNLPFDLSVLVLAISVIISFSLTVNLTNIYYNFHLDDVLIHLFFITVMFGITFIQSIYFYRRVRNRDSEKEIWQNMISVRAKEMVHNAFVNRRVGTQIFLILAVVFLLGIFLGLGANETGFFVIFFFGCIIVGLPLFILILKRIGYFNKILLNTRALAKGEFEPDIKIVGKSFLAKLAEDINLLKYGVKNSQNAQAKSERLKTELITNVSHDLRTPLTSIITYTELLKKTEISEDERKSYVEIIDRKSQRLKVLIDDLFEASKMASGNIELTKAKVDIVQLLQQSLAEYHESMQDSKIQFRISNPDHPVYAFVDGQKLWRVFENLLGNIYKYALENTRAYINVKTENNQVIITFKNVSKYELNDDTDELFERFKRGDQSRHTDGSGLGLAIAKSIIDLHEGTLDLDVDGDLFKVIVKLDLYNQ
ncbi:histidine kinase dimerization/phospho-acceptor domain-containing protein [Pseudoneobacillus sp. C159]